MPRISHLDEILARAQTDIVKRWVDTTTGFAVTLGQVRPPPPHPRFPTSPDPFFHTPGPGELPTVAKKLKSYNRGRTSASKVLGFLFRAEGVVKPVTNEDKVIPHTARS